MRGAAFFWAFLGSLLLPTTVSRSSVPGPNRQAAFCYRGQFMFTKTVVILTFTVPSHMMCTMKCLQHDACVSYNFFEMSGHCRLSASIPNNELVNKGRLRFIPGYQSWSLREQGCSILPEFGPFHIQSPVGRYKILFEDAASYCGLYGAALLSPEQMRAAFNTGMNVCLCGWLSDSSARYPIQVQLAGCGSVGVNHCGWYSAAKPKMKDVYCYKSA